MEIELARLMFIKPPGRRTKARIISPPPPLPRFLLRRPPSDAQIRGSQIHGGYGVMDELSHLPLLAEVKFDEILDGPQRFKGSISLEGS